MSLQSTVVFEGQGRSHDMPILSGHFWTFSSKSLGVQKPDVKGFGAKMVGLLSRFNMFVDLFSYIQSNGLAGSIVKTLTWLWKPYDWVGRLKFLSSLLADFFCICYVLLLTGLIVKMLKGLPTFLLGAGVVLLTIRPLTPTVGFSQANQEPSKIYGRKQPLTKEIREREGNAMRRRARQDFGPNQMSKAEKILLRKIASASEQRDWPTVQSLIDGYAGTAEPIWAATINAALRCGRYREGALIFEKCKQNVKIKHEPLFNAAVKVLAKCQEWAQVREVWEEALKACKFGPMMAAARLAAAADEGDVQTAAAVLDLMETNDVAIDVQHLTTAIRACWGYGKSRHKAAKYFFDLFARFDLEPDLIAFASLVGSYHTAPLELVMSAYDDMKKRKIKANHIFAEIYLAALLQKRPEDDWPRTGPPLARILADLSSERLEAAKKVLDDFDAAEVRLTQFGQNIKRALKMVKMERSAFWNLVIVFMTRPKKQRMRCGALRDCRIEDTLPVCGWHNSSSVGSPANEVVNGEELNIPLTLGQLQRPHPTAV